MIRFYINFNFVCVYATSDKILIKSFTDKILFFPLKYPTKENDASLFHKEEKTVYDIN